MLGLWWLGRIYYYSTNRLITWIFEAIAWLEGRLTGFAGAVLFITHDRAFLQRLATRIVEIDRGQLRSWPGDYAQFLKRRAAALATERLADGEFDRKLAEEEAWIRQGDQGSTDP